MRILLCLVLPLCALALTGCATAQLDVKPFTATGNALQQAHSYVDAAEQDVKAIKPHVDATGAAILPLVSDAHAKATKQIEDGTKALEASLKAAQDAVAKAETAARDAEARTHAEQAKVTALEHSWGHRLQVWVTWAFWIIVVLLAFHLIGSIVAMFLPSPYGTVIGIAAKIVNPAGWLSWGLTHVQNNRALAAAAAVAK